MDEQTVNQQQTPLTEATPGAEQATTPLASGSSVTAAPRTDLPQGVYDYSEQIASMYDAQQAAKEQSLANAYQQNVATLEREREKISPLYQTQANDLSTQYERNRRNMNFQADLNGLNTGTASQMDLAQNNAYLNSFGKLRASEAEALRAADQQKADLEMSYKNAVAQALADNDYQKAAALMSEYQRRDAAATAMEQYNRPQQEADAKLKAAYGDFSGYEDLYGAETAKQMRDFFLQANPQYAWANGLMDANTYYKLTGRYPAGYSTGSSKSGRYNTKDNDEGGDDTEFQNMVEQLIIQGVPYADAVKMLNGSGYNFSDYNAAKKVLDAAYQSTWKGGTNEGMFNVANNSAEDRGSHSWVNTHTPGTQRYNDKGYQTTTGE